MSALLYVRETPEILASTGSVELAFKSGDEVFRVILPRHTAQEFRHRMMTDAWPVLCAPEAQVVPLYAGCNGCKHLSKYRTKATR